MAEKISVSDYLKDKTLLEVTYLPFDTKLQIVSHVLGGMIESIGGLNTSLLRRISTEVFIDSITNIDMNIVDENDLKGFDQLCFNRELENLEDALGNEYAELQKILDERVADYIRTEINPAVTINAIYNQVVDKLNDVLVLASKYIQEIDIDALINMIGSMTSKIEGVTNESK